DATVPTDEPRRFVKRGDGTLTFDTSTGTMLVNKTIFRVEEGTMELLGLEPLGASDQPIELAGGTMKFGVQVGGLSPLAHYSFDNIVDTTVVNEGSTGSAADGTLMNGASIDLGQFGNALSLDGVNQFVEVPDIDALEFPAGQSFSVSLWYKRDGVENDQGLLTKGYGDNPRKDNYYLLQTRVDGFTFDSRRDSGGTPRTRIDNTSASHGDNVWHHFVVVRDSEANEIRTYVDGQDDPVVYDMGGDPPNNGDWDMGVNTEPLAIGDHLNRYTQGMFDEVWMYDVALDQAVVDQLYAFNAGAAPPAVLNLTANDVVVSANSTLELRSAEGNFGNLVLSQGVVTFEGNNAAIIFTGTEVPKYTGLPGEPPDDRVVGVSRQVPTDLGAISANDSTATIVKAGPEDLVLNPGNTGLDSATFVPLAGRTISVGTGPLGDVTVKFGAAFPAPTDSVGHWAFDETSGLTASNSAAPGTNDGTLVNMDDNDWVAGKIGGALAFDGSNDYVNVAQDDRLPIYNNGVDNAFTVAMWVKGGPQNDQRVFSEGSTTTGTPLFNMGTNNSTADGRYAAYIRPESGPTLNHPRSVAEPFDDTWHHIAWVDDNGTVTLYVDGLPDDGNFDYTRGTMPSLNTTTIGGILRASHSHCFEGLIDDVRAYDRALDGLEVGALYGLGGSAGELAVSSPDGNPFALNNAILVETSGTLSAGQYDTGVAGTELDPIAVTLSNLGLTGVLTLNATDYYSFAIPGALTSPAGGLILA
ncbi:MAG: LamG domain-containing protein, partial [Planctomycetota bacterium]